MTGPVLEVDVDGLGADGQRLTSLGDPLTQSNCAPPGSDSVSSGAAAALNEHELALIGLLDYASLVRQHGGAIVRSAAVAFELADQAGAESIHRIDKTGAPPVAPSSGPLVMPVLPPLRISRPLRAIPRYRRRRRLEATSFPPSCIQARVRVICGTFRAIGTTTAATSPIVLMTPGRSLSRSTSTGLMAITVAGGVEDEFADECSGPSWPASAA